MGSRAEWINRGAVCPSCGHRLRVGWVDVPRFWSAIKHYYTPGRQGAYGTPRLNGFSLSRADQASIEKLKKHAHKKMREEIAERILVHADLDPGILDEVRVQD